MARKVRLCNRCPLGAELPATRLETISIGDSRFLLDLCEGCGAKLDRDIYAWGQLGEQLEEDGSRSSARMITATYLNEARHAAELRSKQAEAPVPRDLTRTMPRIVMRGMPAGADDWRFTRGMPAGADDWRFTAHAQERMVERDVSVVGALRAASAPESVRPGAWNDTLIHEADGVKVVVNPKTHEILTVASTKENREAV